MIKLTFAGLKVLQNKVERAKGKLEKQVQDNVQKEADYIEIRSKSSAPYDTGELSRSQYREERLKDNYSIIKIGFSAEYAPFQEFGTGAPPTGYFRLNSEYKEFADMAKGFKRSGKVYPVRPRRYFLHHYIVARRSLNRKTGTLMKNLLK